MSLLAGIGQGLMGAGQAVGQGLYAYAMAIRDDERERMRQASLEKRWAKEDARYDAEQAKSDERYQDSLKFRDKQAELASSRDDRADEKQSAAMLGQALERLDSIKKDKAKQIAEMFIDPMTKQVVDQEAYSKAMADLNSSYLEDASKMVQQSGMSEAQINKYGFGMYLPESSAPVAETTSTKPAEQQPTTAAIPTSFDISGWAKGVRQPQAANNTMPKPGETKREMAVDFLLNDRGEVTRKPGLLSPEAIAQQNEYLKRLRESGVQSAYGASMMPR